MYGHTTLLPLIVSLVASGTAVTKHVPQTLLDRFDDCALKCNEVNYELEYNTTDTAYNWCSTYEFASETACCFGDQCDVYPSFVYDRFDKWCRGASPAVNISQTSCFNDTASPSSTAASGAPFDISGNSNSSDSSSSANSINPDPKSNDDSDSSTGSGDTQDRGRIPGIVVGSIGGFFALMAVIIFCIRRNGSGLPKAPGTSTAWRIDEPRPAPVRRPAPSRAPVRSVARPPTPPPLYTAPPPAYRETV